ncbi:MAG: amidohydrolase [Cyclobacteriaceae bacterium]|nr:amidohydrolase [Cyclobacteriaceae bacterium]
MNTKQVLFPRVDAHTHINFYNEALIEFGLKNNIRFLSINLEIPEFPSLHDQEEVILKLRKKYGTDVINYATSFSMTGWEEKKWAELTLEELKRSIARGAVGVKVWKNIGMELKDKKNDYLDIDHPVFDPIFDYLAAHKIPLLGHIGEPKNCWLPLENMTVFSDQKYFSQHPEFHMYKHPDLPNYQHHLDARDNMLRKHPSLKYTGLHLASEEWSVDQVSRFLDRFPHAMVDLAERICHLQHQAVTHWQKVYDFFVRYQERIIYGTDMVYMGQEPVEDFLNNQDKRFQMHWQFLAGDETMNAPKVTGWFRGLGLSQQVLENIYFNNTSRWYGGVNNNS